MTPVTVSVVVPAYNAAATLGRTLDALSRQTCFQPYEVIVVDDGSTDNTAEIVRSCTPPGSVQVRYVRQENGGPASARNRGAKLASGEFIAFTDSDCVPHPDWISRLMEGFSHTFAHSPGVGGLGAVAGSYGIANPESRLSRCIHAEILWRHTHLMPEFIQVLGSYNFCVRKSVFEAIGGFNTGYRTASGEDNDLSYKISQAGWRIYFERRALVDHHHQNRLSKYLKEQFRHGFWRVKMYRDHPAMARGDGYTYWKDMAEVPLALLCLVVLILHPLQGLGLLLVFLLLEIFNAVLMIPRAQGFFDGIFFGFTLFFRAFGRMFGFSTGILTFWRKIQ